MREARHDAEVGHEGQPDPGSPFLALARELQAEARRWADDPEAGIESLVDAFDRLPAEARRRTAEATFQSLPAERRWDVLLRLFDDEELRAALAHERAIARTTAAAAVRRSAVVADIVASGVLDTRLLPTGEILTLGLFREQDVQAALKRGRASTSCARRIAVQPTVGDGSLHVLEDVFNPLNGLFVTPDYDERAWRAERLQPHATVRLGAVGDGGFEPVVFPGGRLDVEVAGDAHPGRLHVGWASLAGLELFTPPTDPSPTPPTNRSPSPPTNPASIGGTPP